MDNKSIWIVILAILLALSMFDAKEHELNTDKAKAEIKQSKAINLAIDKELKDSKKSLSKSLDSIRRLRNKDSIRYSKRIKAISKMKAVEVKSELLKDLDVKVDSSEVIQITLNEGKGILAKFIESKQKLSLKGFDVSKSKAINANLNKSIVLKDRNISELENVVFQKDIISESLKKVNRQRMFKISIVSLIIGGTTVAILK